MLEALEPTRDPGWVLSHEGYNVLTESAVESRFALGNGFLGMRAARSVSRGPTWLSWLGYIRWASWPRCYVAGLFDIPNTEPPVPALVPIADWSRVRIVLDGEPLLAREGEMLAGVRRLDLRRGVLLSSWTHRTPAGDHRHRARAAPPVAGGLRDGAAAPAILAGPRRRRGDAGGQLCDGRPRHGADAAGAGPRRLAHGGHGQGRGDGGRRDAAARRRSARPRPPVPAALGLALALRGRPGGRTRPPRRGGPGRHAGGRSGPARRRRAGAQPRAGLARRAGRARGRLGGALGGGRGPHRGRRRPAAGAALRRVPPDQRRQPRGRAGLDRRARPHRRRLLRPRLLGHRDLPAALLHRGLARGGAGAADVPLPHAARRAREGGADRLQGRALRLGIGRHRRGDHARARGRARRRAGRHPDRPDGAPCQRRHRLRGLAVLARHRRRRLLPARRRGDPAGDGPVLGVAGRGGGGRPAAHPPRDRAGRVPRGRGRQRLHQRDGALEHRPRRWRRSTCCARAGPTVPPRCGRSWRSARTSSRTGATRSRAS